MVTEPDDRRLQEAADRLWEAAESGVPCAPVRDLIGATSVEHAYAVAQLNVDRQLARGFRRIGWKIGLTNPAVQRQLGVDQPDFGAIYAEHEHCDTQPISRRSLLQPRAEAEVAVVLDADLDASPVTVSDVLGRVAYVVPAIEVVDSRVEGWDITIADTVADRASAGVHVLGATPVPLDGLDLRAVRMAMTADGEVVSEGTGADCLGHPIHALVWLANTLARLGQPLEAGDVVLTGALGPMVPVGGAREFEAVIEGLGSVRARFDDETGAS